MLAIAGSMSAVNGKGLTIGAWEELTNELENVDNKGRVRGEQSGSLNTVLSASFDSLPQRKQEEFLKTAVLAAGAIAPIEMLRNLWEIQVRCGVRSTVCVNARNQLVHDYTCPLDTRTLC